MTYSFNIGFCNAAFPWGDNSLTISTSSYIISWVLVGDVVLVRGASWGEEYVLFVFVIFEPMLLGFVEFVGWRGVLFGWELFVVIWVWLIIDSSIELFVYGMVEVFDVELFISLCCVIFGLFCIVISFVLSIKVEFLIGLVFVELLNTVSFNEWFIISEVFGFIIVLFKGRTSGCVVFSWCINIEFESRIFVLLFLSSLIEMLWVKLSMISIVLSLFVSFYLISLLIYYVILWTTIWIVLVLKNNR